MDEQEPRWYCVSRDGLATLCAHEQDAAAEAVRLDRIYPKQAPHRAVQLVDAALVAAELDRVRAVALQAVPHTYEGDCPDDLDPTSRDANCPACKILGA